MATDNALASKMLGRSLILAADTYSRLLAGVEGEPPKQPMRPSEAAA